ncbi:universal stress protein [Aureimonas sp. SA4125]|uniref:universal stress protein n=1 Tax=Aureimonas sp. SA4125 TaxID=2826993 RepID=UPI001CC47EFF|nr:universal stress protein [Aureimonas sp. SA4125]BDA83321.1 universal stress protein [Aureimonas sp. SA4125]
MYKTILVVLDSKARAAALVDVALSLAERHDAHLVGVHVLAADIGSMVGMFPAEIPAEFIAETRRLRVEEAEAIEEIFRRKVSAAGADRSEWRREETVRPDDGRILNRHAMCADLVIAGQGPDAAAGSDPVLADLVMGCGRPVLIVPYAGRFERVGDRVLIAWNGTREAARAAADALPLLKTASRVRVLTIDPRNDRPTPGLATADDLVLALARQDVAVEAATSFSGDLSVGDDILSSLADQGSDLLVMGCFGHSRVREMLFGGVTRHILRHMTVPVLMSH